LELVPCTKNDFPSISSEDLNSLSLEHLYCLNSNKYFNLTGYWDETITESLQFVVIKVVQKKQFFI
jgi:hypothetical protein